MAKSKATKPTKAQRDSIELAHARRTNRRLRTENASLRHKAAEDSPMRKDLRSALGGGDYQNWLDREKVINVSRAMDQRSGIFAGMIDRFVEVAIGTGLRPVGNTKAADAAVELFIEWANRYADARRMADWGGLQALALRSMLVDGDVGAALLRQRSVQLIESDQIATPIGSVRDQSFVDGVELEQFTGAPVAYHVSEYDTSSPTLKIKTRRVPAEFFIFMARRKRASMTRGLPLMVASLTRLMGIDEYTDAVEVAAKLQAAMALVIKSGNPAATRDAMATGSETRPGSGDSGTDYVGSLLAMQPGQILTLEEGGEASGVQGNQPSTTFDLFVQAVCRMICAETGFPVEVALGDYSRANFSVARMAYTQAINAVLPWRAMFQWAFCDRIYRWQVAYFILTGQLSGSIDDPDVYDIRWQAPARAVIDPVAEANAVKIALEMNLTTLDAELQARGLDIDQVLEKRAEEVKRQREMGISPPQTPGAKSAGGDQPQPDQSTQPTN